MTGLGFKPETTNDYFVGIVFVSSLQHKYYNAGQIFFNRYSNQIKQMFNKDDYAPDRWLSALGRTYNGHTALMVGKQRNVEMIVGWDPLSAMQAFIKSTTKGYAGMPPLEGSWHNDVGMDGDPTAVFYGLKINEQQYNDFKIFISSLVGRRDLGPHLANTGIDFKYAFAPADWMQLTSSLENTNLSMDQINIVSNCSDAAFHVLSSFLYDWKKPELVAELQSFIDMEHRGKRNFSQGQLMRWAKQAVVREHADA
jgi:hypothetical protein